MPVNAKNRALILHLTHEYSFLLFSTFTIFCIGAPSLRPSADSVNDEKSAGIVLADFKKLTTRRQRVRVQAPCLLVLRLARLTAFWIVGKTLAQKILLCLGGEAKLFAARFADQDSGTRLPV
ncbi:MAG: hypothetical protein AAB445_01935 [Patescibacteria group bacterium]